MSDFDFRGYDAYKCQSPDDAGEPRPGTVAYYSGHAQCLARINALTDLLEEIAAECDDYAGSDWVGEHERYEPNLAMRLLTRIREVVPR